MNFSECLDFVLAREGRYVDDPDDRGGATNFGITQRAYDAWRKKHRLGVQHVKDITQKEVEAVYKEGYWDTIRGDNLPSPLNLVMFDSAVQHSPHRAAVLLQELIGVEADGAIGPKSLQELTTATQAVGVAPIVYFYLIKRKLFYAQIIKNDPTQAKFKNGWSNRMNALRKAAI